MSPLSAKNFVLDDLNGILRFAAANSVFPFHSEKEIERFITRLASSSRNVFDVHQDGERVAVAVLLDNIDNPSNAASLEIVGVKSGAGENVIDFILAGALSVLPPDKSAIHFGHHHSYPIAEAFLVARGFRPIYETYDMELVGEPMRNEGLPSGFTFETLGLEDYDEFYRVMCRAFEKNLETSIPPLEEMRTQYQKRAIPNRVVRFDDALIGHVNVRMSAPKEGEISQIGVLPEHRKRKLGASLLSEGIRILREQGAEAVKLTVAIENDRALNLYRSFGFQVKEESGVFEWIR